MASRTATHVLIAGGGVAALEASLALRALAEERVTVEVLAPETTFRYRPLAVAEPFQLGRVTHFELPALVAATGATFLPGALASVDSRRRLAQTAGGVTISYQALLIACGTVPGEAIPGALTFRGPADVELVEQLLKEIAAGGIRHVVFAVPSGTTWALPIYELALMTAWWLETRWIHGVDLSIVTPEDGPLAIFGYAASTSVQALLDERGIAVRPSTRPLEFAAGELVCASGDAIVADRVVSLPLLRGRQIAGVPRTGDGFIPVDAHGRVVGLSGVYAAGDITSYALKQGGIAAQQADAAAATIAAEAGADLVARPFRPILRAILLDGTECRYLRHEVGNWSEGASAASPEPLWSPPAKIFGRYLGPFLGALAGVEVARELAGGADVAPVPSSFAAGADDADDVHLGIGLGF